MTTRLVARNRILHPDRVEPGYAPARGLASRSHRSGSASRGRRGYQVARRCSL